MQTSSSEAVGAAPAGETAKRLDAAAIVRAGLQLAATKPVETISVRALGAELGTDPTAIYRHFRSKDDLMRALLDALHVQALDRIPETGAWQQRLMDLADATLEVHIAHPAIAIEAVTLTTGGPGEARTIEYILGALGDAGLADDEIVHYYALVGSYILSRTSAISRARLSRRARTQSEASSWLDGPLLIDPGRQPRTAALLPELSELRDDEIYRSGIRLIIESAERTAEGSAD